jgi:hypothetical protein
MVAFIKWQRQKKCNKSLYSINTMGMNFMKKVLTSWQGEDIIEVMTDWTVLRTRIWEFKYFKKGIIILICWWVHFAGNSFRIVLHLWRKGKLALNYPFLYKNFYYHFWVTEGISLWHFHICFQFILVRFTIILPHPLLPSLIMNSTSLIA